MEASRNFTKDSISAWVTDYLAEVLEVDRSSIAPNVETRRSVSTRRWWCQCWGTLRIGSVVSRFHRRLCSKTIRRLTPWLATSSKQWRPSRLRHAWRSHDDNSEQCDN